MAGRMNPGLLIGFSDLIKQFYSYKSEELRAVGAKMIHCKMIHLLSDYDGISQQEIADMTGVSRSTMSETLTEMVKEGYIERRVDAGDKRVSLIYLSDLGHEKAGMIRDSFDSYCDYCVRNFDKGEIEQFERLLRKFTFTA